MEWKEYLTPGFMLSVGIYLTIALVFLLIGKYGAEWATWTAVSVLGVGLVGCAITGGYLWFTREKIDAGISALEIGRTVLIPQQESGEGVNTPLLQQQ